MNDQTPDPDLVDLFKRMQAPAGTLANALLYLLRVRERELLGLAEASEYDVRVTIEDELRQVRDMIAQVQTIHR